MTSRGSEPVLQDIGLDSQRRGIEPGHYVTLGKALLWAFEQTLAEDFTPVVKDAWAVLCASVSGAMLQGAEPQEAYSPRGLSSARDVVSRPPSALWIGAADYSGLQRAGHGRSLEELKWARPAELGLYRLALLC